MATVMLIFSGTKNFLEAEMHKVVRVVPLVVLSLFAGCSEPSAPIFLTLHRAQWEKQNLHHYSYTGRRSCLCPESGKEVLVIVLSDTVYSARIVGTTIEQPKGAWLTVDQLFDFAATSYQSDVYDKIRVEYHPELGYPTIIEGSCPDDILDCGFTLEVKDLGGLSFLD